MDNLYENKNSPINGTECQTRFPNNIINKLLDDVEVLHFWANKVKYTMSVDTKKYRDLIIKIKRQNRYTYWNGGADVTISLLSNERERFLEEAMNWTHDKNNEIFKTLRTVSNHIREKEDQTEHERVMMRLIEINNRLPLLKLPLLGMPYGDMYHSNHVILLFETELRDMAEYYGKRDNKEYDLSRCETKTNLLNRCFEDIQNEYKRISAK